MSENNNGNNKKYKSGETNPIGNVGAIWNKCGAKNDFMLMKITVDKPGNHTFVIFPNENKGKTQDEFYDKNPAHFIFQYRPKNKENGENFNK